MIAAMIVAGAVDEARILGLLNCPIELTEKGRVWYRQLRMKHPAPDFKTILFYVKALLDKVGQSHDLAEGMALIVSGVLDGSAVEFVKKHSDESFDHESNERAS